MEHGHGRYHSALIVQIKLAFNATPLLSPLTGIGHYTAALLEKLQGMDDLDAFAFYSTSWLTPPWPLMRYPMAVVRNLLQAAARRTNRPLALGRTVQQQIFDRGLTRFGINLYHEPNYCPMDFPGPTVVTVCDMAYIRHPETMPEHRLRLLHDCMPKVAAHARHILVISEFTKSELVQLLGVSPERVTVTYPGVRSQFRPRAAAEIAGILSRHDLNFGGYLLFVGTLEPRKNLVRTLRAYGSLPEGMKRRLPLVLAGMSGWLTDEIEADLGRPALRPFVRRLDYVPETTLPGLFSGAAMLVYPSLYEGFGMPLTEAMASGIPVISSNCASMPEVAGDAAVLVNPLDIDAIANAIRRVAENPAEAARLSALGIARASSFTWANCAAPTVEVYRRCVAA